MCRPASAPCRFQGSTCPRMQITGRMCRPPDANVAALVFSWLKPVSLCPWSLAVIAPYRKSLAEHAA